MEREAIIRQITENVLAESNSYHDRLGRFTSKENAVNAVRDFVPDMAHGLRAGRTARIAGPVRVNGKVLKDAVIGKAPNGNRFIRGVDERGTVRHINLGVENKTKIGAPRKARGSEQASMAKAHQARRPIPMDKWNNFQVQRPAAPPIPQQGKVTMQKQASPAGDTGTDTGRSPLLTSTIQSSRPLRGDERGVNETHILTFEDGSKAVWKPMDAYRLDHKKEAVAYDVAKTLGMTHLVPETVIRKIDGRVGSVQRFVSNAQVAGKLWDEKSMYDGDADLRRSAAFDYLICHTDRHDYNWMVDSGGSLHLIDHGYSMPDSTRTPYSKLLDQANGKNMSLAEIHQEWGNTWPNLEADFVKRGMKPRAIDLAKERYFKLMRAQTFKEL